MTTAGLLAPKYGDCRRIAYWPQHPVIWNMCERVLFTTCCFDVVKLAKCVGAPRGRALTLDNQAVLMMLLCI